MDNDDIIIENENLLVPSEDYLKAGVHIGTKFKTKYMEKFIFKTRTDGLSVFDIPVIDERIKAVATLLSKYSPEEILIVSRRENGWKPVTVFSKLIGCHYYAGRYPPGVLTNSNLRNFLEPKVILVVDPWPDKNVVDDASLMGVPVIALCDTNNQTNNIDLVLPCNNKGKKSLGLIFWILAKEFLTAKGLLKGKFEQEIGNFTEE